MATSLETHRRPPTSDQLRTLHAQLSQCAATARDAADFFNRFLTAAVGTLGAAGGAAWSAEPAGFQIAAAVGLDAADLPRSEEAARRVFADGAGRVAAGPSADEAPSASAGDLLLYPVRLGTTTCGVVALVLPSDAPPAMRPTLQRILVPLCDHAAEFLHRRRRDTAGSGSAAPVDSALAAFALEVHRSLDLKRTAAAVANETCRLVDCDRVAVLRYRHRKAETLAVSGQDFLDRRASLVRRLEALAAAVAAAGESLTAPDDENARAPQVEAPLQAYLEEAHCRSLSATPLRETSEGEVVGVIVVEQIATAAGPAERHRRVDKTHAGLPTRRPVTVDMLLPHAVAALGNAARHESSSLLSRSPLAKSTAASMLFWVGAPAAAMALLWLMPYDFAVEARGTLQPIVRRDVFAPIDGTVDKIFVRHGDRVQPGDPLFELRSTELDVAEADLIKQINETEQEFVNAQRQYNDGRTLTAAEQSRLVGQIATLEQRRESLRKQAALFAEKRQRLRVAAPIAGQIATWNVDELLAERPVRQGQTLTALVDPDGEWEVEIRVPEDRFGYVVEAQHALSSESAASPPPQLEIIFVLASDPGREYRGRIVETHLAAEQRGEEGNVILVRAAIDKRQLAQLHPGTEARVRVECGSRSLGYVLLHDVWNFVQTRILFKL